MTTLSQRMGCDVLCVLLGLVTCGITLVAQPQEIRIPETLPDPVGEEMRVEPARLDSVLEDSDVILLDIREAWELQEYGTREGYVHIPLAELEERLEELPTDKMILTA